MMATPSGVYPSTSLTATENQKKQDIDLSSFEGSPTFGRNDDLQSALLEHDEWHRARDARIKTLRDLSNPFPSGTHQPRGHPSQRRLVLEKKSLPLDVFRRIIHEEQKTKHKQTYLKVQLLCCEWPRDILRVIAIALRDKNLVQWLTTEREVVVTALYQCRRNVSDPEVLRALGVIIARFRHLGIHVSESLMITSIKFAARSRNLCSMKKYLRLFRQSGFAMSRHTFRSVIAKCSIGKHGLGFIRNGRWRPEDLRQVLVGFDDASHLPPNQQYHLGSFLEREDWRYLQVWTVILAHYKEADELWKEWQYWKPSEASGKQKRRMGHRTEFGVHSWFIRMLLEAGSAEKAWKIQSEVRLPLSNLTFAVKDQLLDAAEHATVWDREMRDEMIQKYDRDMSKIERELGVRWIPGEREGDGHHEIDKDSEATIGKVRLAHSELCAGIGCPWHSISIQPKDSLDDNGFG
jgi:hypothetical protein